VHTLTPRPIRILLAGLLSLAVVVASAPADAAARSGARYPSLSPGNRGVDVFALQHLLRHHGQAVRITGFFDGATRDALAAFQRQADLAPDGIASQRTWQALVPELRHGSTGEAVLAVRQLLNAKHQAGLDARGPFDASVEAAVQAFRMRAGLRQSGALDEPSWRHLLGGWMQPELDGAMCGYDLHAGPSRKWGTAAAVAQLSAAAELFQRRTGQRLAVGDISFERGGRVSGHRTHRVGLDVDVRAARSDGRSCRAGIAHTMRSYDREGTRELIRAIHDAAPGKVKLIYFNDPVLVREGLTVRYPNHDAHLHIRYCEADHPLAAYRCAATSVDPSDLVDALPAVPGRRVSLFVLGSVASESYQSLSAGVRKPPLLDAAGSWFGRCWAGACSFAR
jgi:peptidoglycan hydrolase-like protein with peptidoglycan-binding domain